MKPKPSPPRKHIARTGAQAGQWVTCPAQQSCRNRGLHVTTEQLQQARLLYQETTGEISDVPIPAVLTYMNADAGTKQRLQDTIQETQKTAHYRNIVNSTQNPTQSLTADQKFKNGIQKLSDTYSQLFRLGTQKPLEGSEEELQHLFENMVDAVDSLDISDQEKNWLNLLGAQVYGAAQIRTPESEPAEERTLAGSYNQLYLSRENLNTSLNALLPYKITENLQTQIRNGATIAQLRRYLNRVSQLNLK